MTHLRFNVSRLLADARLSVPSRSFFKCILSPVFLSLPDSPSRMPLAIPCQISLKNVNKTCGSWLFFCSGSESEELTASNDYWKIWDKCLFQLSQAGHCLSYPLCIAILKGNSLDRKEHILMKTITKTYLYNLDPLKPHFYIVKLGFTGVYIIFLISAQNIDCGYSLEPPRRGGSNEYPQYVF